MERERLNERLAENSESMKNMKGRIEALEVELVRTKQDLGEALNAVNDFELKNIDLHRKLEKAMALNALKVPGEPSEAKRKGKK